MAADVSLKLTANGFSKLSQRLKRLVEQATNLRSFMEDAAEYMVRSTKNRIFRTHLDPNGNPWAVLAALTVELKGHDRPLFESGRLVESIKVSKVTPKSFTIEADPVDKRGRHYAEYVQGGVRRNRGTITMKDGRKINPRGSIPARPFMGISDANISRLSRMLKEHLEQE